ncbi:MAG: Rrf2 family transcriptional regulator [Deltaproteobacteria bacterium]|nr:Rrf2 family transcriptional regulator [Deltaproteobacteria bacterium]
MRISRETDYAIRCLIFMARRPLKVHTVMEVARPRGIPPSFLAKILQKFVKSGILSSARGVRGGFRLTRSPADITLLQVIEAVEGPISLNDCMVERETCSLASRCAAHSAWKEIQGVLAAKLGEYTIRMLADQEEYTPAFEAGIAEEGP